MRQFTFTDIHRRLGQVMDAAEASPVMITKRGKPALVMMSKGHYEAMVKRNGALATTGFSDADGSAVPA